MIRDTEQPPYGETINSELPREERPLREGCKAIRNMGDMDGNRLLAISYSVQGHIFLTWCIIKLHNLLPQAPWALEI